MLELFWLFSLIQEAVSSNIQLPLTVIGWVSNIRRISQFGYLSCQFNRNQLYMFDFETHLILLSSKELSNISEGSLFIGIKGLKFFNNLRWINVKKTVPAFGSHNSPNMHFPQSRQNMLPPKSVAKAAMISHNFVANGEAIISGRRVRSQHECQEEAPR